MCSKIDWYFANESNPSDRLVDQFKDSKFSIDKWTSFTREIIQNALDVPIEENGTKYGDNKGLTSILKECKDNHLV